MQHADAGSDAFKCFHPCSVCMLTNSTVASLVWTTPVRNPDLLSAPCLTELHPSSWLLRHTPRATPTSKTFLAKLPRLKPRPYSAKTASAGPSNGKGVRTNTDLEIGGWAGYAACSVGDECNVCWDEYSEDQTVLQLPCNHCFHEGCILKWLEEVRARGLGRRQSFRKLGDITSA